MRCFLERKGWTKLLTKGLRKEGGKTWKTKGCFVEGWRTKGGALTNLGLRLGPSVTFRSYSLGLPLTMKKVSPVNSLQHISHEKDAVEAWRCNTHLRLRWSCYFHLEAGVTKTCGSAEIREPSVVLTSLQITVESLIVFVVTIDF